MEDRLKDYLLGLEECNGLNPSDIELSYPDDTHGDLTTNLALKLAKIRQQPPRELAQAIADRLKSDLPDIISDVSVAGPGFINLRILDSALLKSTNFEGVNVLKGKVIVTEFSDPNPFKMLHAGHLYTSVVGDAISRLLEWAGASVHRVNYGGDVGLHVAKTMWAIIHSLGGVEPDKLNAISEPERPAWLSQRYVEGTSAYEDDAQVKTAITELNQQLYQVVASNDHQTPLAKIYWTARDWSYDYFRSFYQQIGINFERFYPESQVASLGVKLVSAHTGSVFEPSDGAIVFIGEKHGLHTRVFLNSKGLPTYDAKELGLAHQKWQDYHYDQAIIITGNEQEQYFQVVLKALSLFAPELAASITAMHHGMVRLSGGKKMSSRLGNIITADQVIAAAREAAQATHESADQEVVLGAIKHAFLRTRMGGDVVYDPKESVSLVGNSGPYLQYAHARSRSILRKSDIKPKMETDQLDPYERPLAVRLARFQPIVTRAALSYGPQQVCTYLYELSQVFNRFYEHSRVIGSEREELRLGLVNSYADALKTGLGLLGIESPDVL